MKKMLLMLSVVSALCCGTVTAGDKALPENPDFTQIRNANLSAEKIQSIKSARLIYSVLGSDIPKSSFIVLRAKRPDQVRLDVLYGKEHYCAVRNGKDFWVYNRNDGSRVMNEDDAKSFELYIACQAIPFNQVPVFGKGKYEEDKTVNNVVRSEYEFKAVNGLDATYKLWIEKNTLNLRKMEIREDDARSVLMFRDFKKFNGIQMAGSIAVTCPLNIFTMKLVSADWDLSIDDAIFKKTDAALDPDLATLKAAPDSDLVKSVAARKTSDQEKQKKLRLKITKLKLEIADNEKKLEAMEGVYKHDREASVSLASQSGGGGSRSYWNGSGWSRSHFRDSSATTRKKEISSMKREAESIAKEHEKLSKKLIQQRVELEEAEMNLKELSEGLE